jgi:hypothetical protein
MYSYSNPTKLKCVYFKKKNTAFMLSGASNLYTPVSLQQNTFDIIIFCGYSAGIKLDLLIYYCFGQTKPKKEKQKKKCLEN